MGKLCVLQAAYESHRCVLIQHALACFELKARLVWKQGLAKHRLCSTPLATELHTHWAMLCWWLPAAAPGRQDHILAMTPGAASKLVPLSLSLNGLWLAGRLVEEDRPVLWHDCSGYHLFGDNTVFAVKPEHVCRVSPGHIKYLRVHSSASRALLACRWCLAVCIHTVGELMRYPFWAAPLQKIRLSVCK